MPTRFPARVHVLLASAAPVGVVIRRGPSKSVCTMLWDRRDDTFAMGQWLKGRIYERRSDLSPDGQYMIYFAMNGKWKGEARGAWSAISHAPYLKAIALFPKGDCWNGGGLWTGKRTYWRNGYNGEGALINTTQVKPDDGNPPEGRIGGECLGVYYPRLLRDGWRLVDSRRATTLTEPSVDTFEKKLKGGWVLRKRAHAGLEHPDGRGCYWDEHALFRSHHGVETLQNKPDWEWAERDGNRLVWVSNGCLFAAPINDAGLGRQHLLHDFNGMTFEPIAAPY